MNRPITMFLLLILALALVGCRGGNDTLTPDEANIEMGLSVAPPQPAVGNATLVVTLRDANGDPLNDAVVRVRGDMNHAGMQPVLADGRASENGDYVVPFEWTMSGDWFVVVTATLPDGTEIEDQFDYTVSGEMDGDEAAN